MRTAFHTFAFQKSISVPNTEYFLLWNGFGRGWYIDWGLGFGSCIDCGLGFGWYMDKGFGLAWYIGEGLGFRFLVHFGAICVELGLIWIVFLGRKIAEMKIALTKNTRS